MLKTLETFKVKALVSAIPGWLLVGLTALGGGIWGYIQSNSADALKDAAGGNWKAIEVIAVHALIAGFGAFLAYLKTDPWTQAQTSQIKQAEVKLPGVNVLLPFGLLLSAMAFASGTQACSPAQTAELKSIESTVLADVEANASDAKIVADVVAIVATNIPATPAEVAFATALAYDAITFLVDSGIIPASFLPSAKTHQAALKALAGK